jgi:S-adenosylmethionine:tRNA ribosyltransferase-isomerase
LKITGRAILLARHCEERFLRRSNPFFYKEEMMDLMDFPEPPAELIAQRPLEERDAARLMVLNRSAETIEHKVFRDLPGYFRPGDVLVLNDVRVFPARLVGVKPTGGRVKMLLLEKSPSGDRWTSLLTPAQRPGTSMALSPDLSVRVEGKRPSGEYEVVFSRPVSDDDLARLGRMPLPPYIRRGPSDDPAVESLDRAYYQTVFAAPAMEPPAAQGFTPPGAPGCILQRRCWGRSPPPERRSTGSG